MKPIRIIIFALTFGIGVPGLCFQFGAGAQESFDLNHTLWRDVLEGYVKAGMVDYRALDGSEDSQNTLDQYLNALKVLTVEEYRIWSDEQKISFWLNAYNALSLRLILDHYPLERQVSIKALAYPENSIQQIPDVWDRKLISIMGQERSLNDIEHGLLRKVFSEPRIHFALVCASVGCPSLRDEPYEASRLDAQLDDQVRRFLSDEEKMFYDPEKNRIHLSPIFKWFSSDFEDQGGVTAFVKKYVSSEDIPDLSENTRIEWLNYDWSLNGE